MKIKIKNPHIIRWIKQLNVNLLLTLLSLISAGSTCTFTYFMWKSNEKMADVADHNLQMEKYRQTIVLSARFNNIYRDLNTKELDDMMIFQIWENPTKEFPDSLKIRYKIIKNQWEDLSDSTKIRKLMYNNAFTEIFGMLEEAMLLNKKKLLDLDYFNNFFYTVMGRLQETSKPTVSQIIDEQCRILKQGDIWEGYRYCQNYLLYEYIFAHLEQNDSIKPHNQESIIISKIFIKTNEFVKKGTKIITIKDSQDKIYTFYAKRDGIIDKILYSVNDTVHENDILVQIRPLEDID